MGWLVLEGKGGDRSLAKQVEIPAAGTLLCGRSSQADLMLSATAVSRRHAIFFRESDRDWVRDAGSTNGTLLNGTRIDEPRPLADGDRVEVGVVLLVYREFVAAPPSRAPRGEAAPPTGGLLEDTRRWRDVTLIGRGGMGEVYRAEDRDLETRVAIKRLRRRSGGDPRLLERLHAREAALGRTIEHPNVVRVLEDSVVGDDPVLLLEWVEGKDLVERVGELSPLERLEILRQTALGLDAAHRAGIVHADLKPANLLLVAPSTGHAPPAENLSILESGDDEPEPGRDDALEREIAERIGLPEKPDFDRLPFVGREAELAYLTEIAREVTGGGCRWVLLFGERGVGRRRFVRETQIEIGSLGLDVPVESPEEWGAPPADFTGVWITPLPPFFPEDPDFERAANEARERGEIRELYLKPFLRGPALRLVERVCRDRESARAFVDAVGREVSSSPALLRQALIDAFDRGAWQVSGGGYRLDVAALRLDERAVAEQLLERWKGEEKGVRDLLSLLSPVGGAIDFAAIGEISSFDSATLYYLVGHAEKAGYLRRVGGTRLAFVNHTFRRTLDHGLDAAQRKPLLKRILAVLENRLEQPGAETELFLSAAEIAREEGRASSAFQWSLRAALMARQGYDRESFFAAVDGARDRYRQSKEGSEKKSLQQIGATLLGPGGRGLDGLDRLRRLPIAVSVKITDFGIARRVDESDAGTTSEVPWGTPRYMSPEQGRGEVLTTASDVFSLGLVAREILEGEHPLRDLKGKNAVRAIVLGDARPPAERDRAEPWDDLIHRMLAPDPDERPNALEVADELQRIEIRTALSSS